MLLARVSLLLFSRLGTRRFWSLLPAMLVGGIGMAIDDDADDGGRDGLGAARQGGRRLGRAEQLRQVGGSLGIAIMGAIVAAGAVERLRRRRPAGRASSNGFHDALEVAAVIALAGAVVGFATIAQAAPRREPSGGRPAERRD